MKKPLRLEYCAFCKVEGGVGHGHRHVWEGHKMGSHIQVIDEASLDAALVDASRELKHECVRDDVDNLESFLAVQKFGFLVPEQEGG